MQEQADSLICHRLLLRCYCNWQLSKQGAMKLKEKLRLAWNHAAVHSEDFAVAEVAAEVAVAVAVAAAGRVAARF